MTALHRIRDSNSGSRPLFRSQLLPVLCVLLTGCVHAPSREQRLTSVGALEAAGEYLKAVVELRALINETRQEEAAMRAILHLRLTEILLDLNLTSDAIAEARRGLALKSEGDPSDAWFRTLVLVGDHKLVEASKVLAQAVAERRVDVREFAEAKWLTPLRSLPGYRALVASLILNAGGLADDEMRALNAAGGIKLSPLHNVIAAPEANAGVCSLAVIQVREAMPANAGLTRIVGELVGPRIEGTGVEYHKEFVTTTVDTSYQSAGSASFSSRTGVFWGSSLLSSFGFARSTVKTESNVPRTSYSVVLNPQDLFALFQYSGLDQALLQNRVAVVFACVREVGPIPRALLQQQRAPVMDVVAYMAFEADGLPVRRSASEPVLSQ